jgi:hypothetical protein
MPYPRGLTWVEGLAIVACLVVLAATFSPRFARPNRGATQSACMNNQQQIVLAATMYASDTQGTLPKADGWSSAIGVDAGVLKCPKAPGAYAPE